MPGPADPLEQLAAAHGVATRYQDWSGREVAVGREAVVAALSALDIDASSPAAVAAALAGAAAAGWGDLLPPFTLARGGPGTVRVVAPDGQPVALRAVAEDGTARELAAGVTRAVGRHGALTAREVALPDLPHGWYTLHAEAAGRTARGTLLVAPRQLAPPGGRAWGWATQLYSLRSGQSWGIGDYGDLAELLARSAPLGAGLVLVNPLHAETPVAPLDPSPYAPSSRLFRSVLGIAVPLVPEYLAAPVELRDQVDRLRPEAAPDRVDRDAAWSAKLAGLELLWPLHRAAGLAAWRAARGPALERFALFCALAEQHGPDWRGWPEALRHPDGPAARAAAGRLAGRVAFFAWLQLLADEQLAGAARAAADLPVGVVHDLAVGVAPGGADAWAFQDVLALGASVGAPPDSFNQRGQDWGLPPWRPDRLRATGYAPFRDLVRAALRHAGGVRIDHVMGLFRLWWVPAGAGADRGTYVSYDAEALLSVLALEAQRAGAVLVGEDLGTVEERVRTELSATGVLGSAVLWFEQDAEGRFLEPKEWRADAMASISTHDLPTAAGFLAGEHVRVRDELGQLGRPVAEERAQAQAERAALLRLLAESGLLERCGGDELLALHALLAEVPSRLVLAAFPDLVGDLRQPNLPGTIDEYPNWRLPVADRSGRPLALAELLAHPRVLEVARMLRESIR